MLARLLEGEIFRYVVQKARTEGGDIVGFSLTRPTIGERN